MNIKNLFNMIFKKGFRVGYSTGKSFNPAEQKRTNPIEDMLNQDKKRKGKK